MATLINHNQFHILFMQRYKLNATLILISYKLH